VQVIKRSRDLAGISSTDVVVGFQDNEKQDERLLHLAKNGTKGREIWIEYQEYLFLCALYFIK
jgi:hypothetical protein